LIESKVERLEIEVGLHSVGGILNKQSSARLEGIVETSCVGSVLSSRGVDLTSVREGFICRVERLVVVLRDRFENGGVE